MGQAQNKFSCMHCGDLSVALSLSRLGSLPWPHCYMWAHSCGLTSACRAHCRGRTAMAHCGGLTAVVSWWSKGTHPQPTKHPQPRALQRHNRHKHRTHSVTTVGPLPWQALEGQGSAPLCVRMVRRPLPSTLACSAVAAHPRGCWTCSSSRPFPFQARKCARARITPTVAHSIPRRHQRVATHCLPRSALPPADIYCSETTHVHGKCAVPRGACRRWSW